jgi:ribosomal protein S7
LLLKLKIKNKKFKSSLFFFFIYIFKFLGFLIFRGNKKLAYKIFYEFKYLLKKEIKVDIINTFYKAMSNLTPLIDFYKKRFGAQKKEIPKPLYGRKRFAFALKLLFQCLKQKFGTLKAKDLVNVIIESSQNKGFVISKKKSMYVLAIRNKYLLQMIKR